MFATACPRESGGRPAPDASPPRRRLSHAHISHRRASDAPDSWIAQAFALFSSSPRRRGPIPDFRCRCSRWRAGRTAETAARTEAGPRLGGRGDVWARQRRATGQRCVSPVSEGGGPSPGLLTCPGGANRALAQASAPQRLAVRASPFRDGPPPSRGRRIGRGRPPLSRGQAKGAEPGAAGPAGALDATGNRCVNPVACKREGRVRASCRPPRSGVRLPPACRFLHRVSFHSVPSIPPPVRPCGGTLIRAYRVRAGACRRRRGSRA